MPPRQSAKLDQLPVELYQYIFQHLQLTELFEIRLVNKKLNYAVSEFSVKELIFESGYKFRYNWSFSRKSINPLNVLPITKQFILRSGLLYTRSLRFLKICLLNNKRRGVNISHINTFVHLIHLEIVAGAYDPDHHLLSLANLKVLSFSIASSYDAKLFILDLPKLTTLNLDCSLHGLLFRHPLTVKRLKTYQYEPALSIFRNVECFECFRLIDKNLNLHLLSLFPQLKELLVEKDGHNELVHIIEEKMSLEKHDVKIYFRSLECLSVEDLRLYRSLNYYLTHYTIDQHFKHYQQLADNLDFVHEMEYHLFTTRFDAIPVDFFDKYTNINKLYVHWCKNLNQNLLLSFIGKCANLGLLSICNSELRQSFFDQLPDVSTLLELYIEDKPAHANLDVSFVLRMESLRIFDTNLKLALNEIKKLCGPHAFHLTRFSVAANRNLVLQIERTKKTMYCLKNENGLKLFNKEINFSTLIAWLEYLKQDGKTRSAFKKMRKV